MTDKIQLGFEAFASKHGFDLSSAGGRYNRPVPAAPAVDVGEDAPLKFRVMMRRARALLQSTGDKK